MIAEGPEAAAAEVAQVVCRGDDRGAARHASQDALRKVLHNKRHALAAALPEPESKKRLALAAALPAPKSQQRKLPPHASAKEIPPLPLALRS